MSILDNFKNPWANNEENNIANTDYDTIGEINSWATSALKTDLFEGNDEVLGIGKEETDEITSGSEIEINKKIISVSEIIDRSNAIKRAIPSNVYSSLTVEEKLIIDLPIILLKLGWKYSAYCQLHWLEGSGEDVNIPYDFVIKYDRSKEALEKIKAKMKSIKFGSIEDYLNYSGKIFTPKGADFLLYNFELDKAREAYYKATDLISNKKELEFNFGNYNMNEQPPKYNFVDSIVCGSIVGDLDDLGGSLGRFSLRVYVKGIVGKEDFNSTDYNLFHLNISEIAVRFGDEFSFEDEQNLGMWYYDTVNVKLPERYKFFSNNKWVNLNNKNYRKLRLKGVGKNFNIFTDLFFLSPAKQTLLINNPIKFYLPK